MNVETSELDGGGVEIRVETGTEVAVVVDTGSGERIYLPRVSGSDDSYYGENPEGLERTDYGYRLVHQGSVEDFEVVR